jgi:hypothetical protein
LKPISDQQLEVMIRDQVCCFPLVDFENDNNVL